MNHVQTNPDTNTIDSLPQSTRGIAPGSRIIVAMSGGVDSCVAAAILA